MYKRILIKVGTNLISDTKGIRKSFLKSFVKQAASLYKKGVEIIIVSSGAIGTGKKRLGITKKTMSLPEKQAAAAVGQVILMQEYKKLFRERKIKTAQVLLDHDDVKHKYKNINARNTIAKLLEWKVIPIINENDTVATEEIKFGDNDALAGIVSGMLNAELAVILTNVGGVYDKNPEKNKNARILGHIQNVHTIIKDIELKGKAEHGTGGMLSKLESARNLNYLGIPLVITNGNTRDALLKAVERKGNDKGEGTFIESRKVKIEGRKKWILTSLKSKGYIKIDDGATEFLYRKGKSLLAVGIKDVSGEFGFGDAVEILNRKAGKVGKGVTNYSSKELLKIKGKNTNEIKKIMGTGFYEEVIHRDNMFIYK